MVKRVALEADRHRSKSQPVAFTGHTNTPVPYKLGTIISTSQGSVPTNCKRIGTLVGVQSTVTDELGVDYHGQNNVHALLGKF